MAGGLEGVFGCSWSFGRCWVRSDLIWVLFFNVSFVFFMGTGYGCRFVGRLGVVLGRWFG